MRTWSLVGFLLCLVPSLGAAEPSATTPSTPPDTVRAKAAADSTVTNPFSALIPTGNTVAELNRVLGEEEDITSRKLWTRQSPGFDQQTLVRCWKMLTDTEAGVAAIKRFFAAEAGPLSLFLALAVGVIVLAAILRRLVAVRLARELGQSLAPMRTRLPATVSRILVSLTRMLSSVLAPLMVLGAYTIVRMVAHLGSPWFQALGIFLAGWTWLATTLAALHELLLGGLLGVPKEHGRPLFRDVRRAAWFGFFGLVAISLARRGGADPEILALARFSVQLTSLFILAIALRWRTAILSLFPRYDNRAYQAFLRWLGRFYVPAFLLTLAIVLAGLFGYRKLATFLLVRSWLIVGIFIATVGLHSMLRAGLRRWMLGGREELSAEGQALYGSTVLLLTYVLVIGVGSLVFRIFGLLTPLSRALGTELVAVGDQQLSMLILIKALAIILIFVFSGRLLSNYFDFQVFPALNVDPGVATAINTLVMGLLVGVGVMIGLSTVGLDLRVLTFFAGALGLGLGFGLQNYASNLVSGLTLIFGRLMRRGDYVSIDNDEGFVLQVGIRATRVRTRDAVEYTVPNAKFLDNQIINWSHSSPLIRLHIPVGVSYRADPQEVRKILLEVAEASPNVQRRPHPDVWFVGYGDSSIDFELLIWIDVKRVAVGAVRSDIYFATFAALAEHGIEIPFPQRDIHIRSGLPGSAPPAPSPPPATS